jgi:hypothetical protein
MPTPINPLLADDEMSDAMGESTKSVTFAHFHVIIL